MKENIRVRFAPSPTGFMHLGNVRSALINYLFAKNKQGTFILRIEDTDATRNIAAGVSQIISDLEWLNLHYDEGPIVGGEYGPYMQSQRANLYSKYLEKLKDKNLVYRCFCTAEDLDKKRKRQISLKMAPRYDRTCLKLAPQELEDRLNSGTSFIWRFYLDDTKTAVFSDMAHKEMSFELKHFSDIPLTRQDGSFTFMFANFVDDYTMKITHVFRGQEHLSNTATQVALYNAFEFKVPTFWHLPLLGNKDGKKLSKRDFGFSLTDLRNDGILPEAIVNYLVLVGASYQKEIMTLQELVENIHLDNISSAGMIQYDFEKLKWVNHQWIMHYNTDKLAELCRPFLIAAYEEVKGYSTEKLSFIIKPIQPEMVTLTQCIELLEFYFKKPVVDPELLEKFNLEKNKELIRDFVDQVKCAELQNALSCLKQEIKKRGLSTKEVYSLLRVGLTGRAQGSALVDIISLLGKDETSSRLRDIY